MILVVGASGLLGGMITQGLLAQGKRVRILQRSNPGYQALIDAGAEAVPGDLKDRASLDRAMKGVEIVITTANAAQRGGSDTFQSVDQQGTLNLIIAAMSANVEQFIYVSAYTADPTSDVPLVRYKGESEHALSGCGLPYTIVKPHIFIEVWAGAVIGIPLQAGQPVTLIEKGDKKHSFISVGDVARATLAMVGNPQAYNQSIALGGPEALSWTELVSMVEKAIGKTIGIDYVRIGAPVPLLPPAMLPLLYSTEMYEACIEMADTSARYGLMLTPAQEALKRMFGGAH